MKKQDQIKVKNYLTIPTNIRDAKGTVLRVLSNDESEVLIGKTTYILKNRYFEEFTSNDTFFI